jgi:5S rRNA maturation endonuclease (ribonuclease M5)/archaellum biogenesis ATPase FlaH
MDNNLSIDRVASILNAKPSGNGYLANCPSHDDKNPSLSINESSDGKLLLKCFSGCDFSSILNAIKEQTKSYSTPKQPAKGQKIITIANNILKDIDKSFLSENRKISAKVAEWANLHSNKDTIAIPILDSFSKEIDTRLYSRPEFRKQNQPKIKGRKGAKAILYPTGILNLIKSERVDILDKIDDSFILLVEGELDALAAISNGFLAITNTCGAATWEDSFSQQLAETGKSIVVLMDNDKAGEKGAISRITSLKTAGVSVHIARWPNERAVGHDIIDELNLYGLDSLRKIIISAESFRSVVSLDEVSSEEIDWLINPYIARKKLTILEGDPGIGKSFLALHYAAKLSLSGITSLIITLEDGLGDTVKPRLESLNANLKNIIAPIETFSLRDEGIDKLENILREEKPALVIVDTLTAASGGLNNNQADQMRPFMLSLSNLSENYNCAFLILRHLNKKSEVQDEYRGSGSIDISGAVRSILQATKDKNDSDLIKVKHVKCNIAKKGEPFGFKIINGVFELAGELLPEPPTKKIEIAVEFLAKELSQGPVPSTLINAKAETLGFSCATLARARKLIGIKTDKVTGEGNPYWTMRLKD